MNGIISLGKGRLSGACMVGDESVIVIRKGGALHQKRVLQGRKIVDDGIISYSSDCYVFPSGRLEMDSEVRFETENQ